ncbi:MAG: SURF1 family cytochrome oxidase biogenesis protein, partial [Alphaproteobacteria bacterium]
MPRSAIGLAAFLLVSLTGVAILAGLGRWQLARRTWKLSLIRQVEQRVH